MIVGAPVDEPYDLSVTFALFQGGAEKRRTIEVKGATEAQIVDAPFAFEGRVRTGRWEAAVEIVWRGETLTSHHRSQPLFPTIHAWRAVVYDRDETKLALDEVMDEKGTVDKKLEWIPFVQEAKGLQNVNQPHGVLFWRTHREQLQAGKKLAAYVVSTVVSPDDREAVLNFRAGGSYRIYLNGQQVEQVLLDEDEQIPIFYRSRKTAIIHLRAGENTLLIDSRPPEEGRPIWFFGGAFTVPGEDEDPMTDLEFE